MLVRWTVLLFFWSAVIMMKCVHSMHFVHEKHSKLSVFDKSQAKVVACAIVMLEDARIREWINYNRFLGFDHVHVFVNDPNMTDFMTNLPMQYGEDFLKITHLPGPMQQIPAYNRCLREYEEENAWIATFDADEFIALKKHATIKDFLRDVGGGNTTGSVVLNWKIFQSKDLVESAEATTKRFIMASPKLNQHIKTIGYVPFVRRCTTHFMLLRSGYHAMTVNGSTISDQTAFNPGATTDVAWLAHYSTKSYEEYRVKRLRGRADNTLEDKYVNPATGEANMLRSFKDTNFEILHDIAVQEPHLRDFYNKKLQEQLKKDNAVHYDPRLIGSTYIVRDYKTPV